ncbi:hypothetical protein [Neobacillus sp.]|nr:hypothetical protein [Neobacillus sp.]
MVPPPLSFLSRFKGLYTLGFVLFDVDDLLNETNGDPDNLTS